MCNRSLTEQSGMVPEGEAEIAGTEFAKIIYGAASHTYYQAFSLTGSRNFGCEVIGRMGIVVEEFMLNSDAVGSKLRSESLAGNDIGVRVTYEAAFLLWGSKPQHLRP